MEGVDTAQAQVQEVAAAHQAACGEFFADVEALASTAADYLAQLAAHANAADAQKLRTAALKARLSQLSKDRRSREAAVAAIVEARQRELDRLLQEERERSGAPPAPSVASPLTTPFQQG